MERQFIYGNRNVPSTILYVWCTLNWTRKKNTKQTWELVEEKKVIIKLGKKTIFFVIVCCSIMLIMMMMMSISLWTECFFCTWTSWTLHITPSSSNIIAFCQTISISRECTNVQCFSHAWMCHHVINVEKHVNKKKSYSKILFLLLLG